MNVIVNYLKRAKYGANKLVTKLYDNIKAYDLEKPITNIIFYLPHKKFLDIIYRGSIYEYLSCFQSFCFASRKVGRTIPELRNYETRMIVLALPSKTDTEKAPEYHKIELIFFNCTED